MDELQRLVTVQSEEDANIAVADGESDIDCQFRSDFKLVDLIPPTNYKEAISFARKFRKILTQSKKTAKGPFGAPCLVTLYLLVLLPDAEGAPTLQNEISNTMVSRYVKLIEEYCELEGKLDGILNDPLVKKLDPFKKHCDYFNSALLRLLTR